MELPDNCRCFVDDVIIPVSWYNIDENSKNIYVRQYQDLSNTKNDQIVPIAVNNHTAETLTEAVHNSRNTAFWGGIFTVTFDERKLKITIQADSQSEVKLFTDDELKASNDWQGADYDSNNLMSANEVLGNFTTQSHTSSNFESGVIDLRRIHNIYIMSENLSTFRTLGPRGESGIIKNPCNNRFWIFNNW